MNFAETRFIFKSSVNIRWHELQNKPIISEISSMVRRRSALIALQIFQDFHHFGRLKVGQILAGPHMTFHPVMKREYHSYPRVLRKASSLNASCSIKTVSAADFPNRKQNFTHTLCSLLSAIIEIAEIPSRHLEKSHNNNHPRLTPRGRLLEYCFDSRHVAAHRATTSSPTTFKFRLFLGPLSYIATTVL